MVHEIADIKKMYDRLKIEHNVLLTSKLTEKEQVLNALYELAEHMCVDGNCKNEIWIKLVWDVISYINENVQ